MMSLMSSVVVLCGGRKKSPLTSYLPFLVPWECRIHKPFESRVALNPGLPAT